MKRPWQIWLLFLLCMAFVLPAMGWLTVKAIELDRSEARHRYELRKAKRDAIEMSHKEANYRQLAELEEDVSRALWRMDTLVTPLIVNESARPYYAYQPILNISQSHLGYALSGNNKVKGQVPIKGSQKGNTSKPTSGKEIAPPAPAIDPATDLVLQVPSPLLVNPSGYVLLNWELNESNQMLSPQLPENQEQQDFFTDNGATVESITRYGKNKKALSSKVTFSQMWDRLPDRTLPSNEVLAMNRLNNDDLNVDNPANQMAFSEQQQEQQIGNTFYNSITQNSNWNNRQSTAPQPQNEKRQQAQPNQPVRDVQQKSTPNIADNDIDPPSNNVRPTVPIQQMFTQQNDAGNNRYAQGRQGGDVQQRRGNASLDQRNRILQRQAQNLYSMRTFQDAPVVAASGPMQPEHVLEGVSSPIWVGSQLLLARRITRIEKEYIPAGKQKGGQDRVVLEEKKYIQGCWLDWPRLREDLLLQISDLLPEADLVPLGESDTIDPARALASLPVQLVVPSPITEFPSLDEPKKGTGAFSPIRMSLWIAWGCLTTATLAIALLLSGVVALSERRASFVAAVTHELRTPLTTFRMYAEMLSEGMVPNQQKRQAYLETLRVEAERLTHLVSNVLSYSRLERGKPGGRREDISLDDLLERSTKRLADRARQADMELVVEASDDALSRCVQTDPAAVEQILFNLVDNACKYAASAEDRRIHLITEQAAGAMRIRVRDHGPGIASDVAGKMFHPFSKSVEKAAQTAPGVGLGLALCRRLVRALGGTLVYEKENNNGASLSFTLPAVESK